MPATPPARPGRKKEDDGASTGLIVTMTAGGEPAVVERG